MPDNTFELLKRLVDIYNDTVDEDGKLIVENNVSNRKDTWFISVNKKHLKDGMTYPQGLKQDYLVDSNIGIEYCAQSIISIMFTLGFKYYLNQKIKII